MIMNVKAEIMEAKAGIMKLTLGSWAVIAALVAILIATIWWAVYAWNVEADITMTTHGYVAMGIGIFLSIAIGCGLMALTFYSSHHGYDDLPQARERPTDNDPAQ